MLCTDRSPEKLLIVRPGYLWGSLHGAYLAKTLGFGSEVEFGVAGGNGLVALEMIADRIEHHLGIKTSVFGFDTGKGLPRLQDARDCLNLFAEGTYPMDQTAPMSSTSSADPWDGG